MKLRPIADSSHIYIYCLRTQVNGTAGKVFSIASKEKPFTQMMKGMVKREETMPVSLE